MLAADVEAAYLRAYHHEHARQVGAITRDRGSVERRLGEASRKVDRLVAAIAAGVDVAEVKTALASAKADKDRLTQELAAIDAVPVLTLHPRLAERYREEVEQLEAAFADPATELEAIPRLRALIARVILTPRGDAPRAGVTIEVVRHIDQLLANGADAAEPAG